MKIKYTVKKFTVKRSDRLPIEFLDSPTILLYLQQNGREWGGSERMSLSSDTNRHVTTIVDTTQGKMLYISNSALMVKAIDFERWKNSKTLKDTGI